MCDPLTMAGASFAMTAVSAVASHSAQAAQASAVRNSAMSSMRDGYEQGQIAYEQNAQEAAQKEREAQKKTRAAVGTAVTSAGEGGLQGSSVALLASDYAGQEAVYLTDVEYNKKAQDSAILSQMKGIRAQAISRINSAPVPSILGTALKIVGGAVSAGSSYQSWTTPRMTPTSGLGIP